MPTLLIDDFRTFDVDKIVRTYDEGIQELKLKKWTKLYLDHDLGELDPKKTGYGIMCWLEQHPEHLPDEIIFVTSNPVGRYNMELVRQGLFKTN